MQIPSANRFRLLTVALTLPFFAAEVANATVTFNWATVGNAGNPADTLVMTKGPAADNTTGYGSVAYDYRISKTQVTNSQYAEFLNAVDPGATNALGVYNTNMSSSTIGGGTGIAYTGGINRNLGAPAGSKYSAKVGQENYPATWINWNSGARFVNWLSNGQGAGNTENGVYDMSISTVDPPPRQAGATIFIPSENEFYKASYYDPTKNGTGGYWQYGVRSDSPPISVAPAGGSTSANYATAAGSPGSSGDIYWQNGSTFDDSLNYLTSVGAYSSATSYYGLFDTDGDVYQWTEGTKASPLGQNLPAYRGGAWYYSSEFGGAALRALYSFRNSASYAWFGLRVASLPAAGLAGDYNGNGSVDAADYVEWRKNPTSFGGSPTGYTTWRSNFGNPPGSGAGLNSANIPEPAAGALALIGGVLLAIGRSERRLGKR